MNDVITMKMIMRLITTITTMMIILITWPPGENYTNNIKTFYLNAFGFPQFSSSSTLKACRRSRLLIGVAS